MTAYKMVCLTVDETVCEDLLFRNRALISVYSISSAISAAVWPFYMRYTHMHYNTHVLMAHIGENILRYIVAH